MPILTLNGPDAIRIRKANALATWGSRIQDNRVEPVAKPAFEIPFRLEPGEKIFTIGSCFIRHLEAKLVTRGFEIPMRELFKTRAFDGLLPETVNNFGTPSIYNELAWAFGEETFDEGKGVVELGENSFVDLHMVNSIAPGPLDIVLARRQGLLDATRSLADCRVMIMTLGLAEIWWDELAQTYLNTPPPPSVMKAAPGRFSLHVLRFSECHDYLQRALDIAFRHGRKDLQVILTVSPAPMMATHRHMDVITANSYSKSLLRTVAEHVVEANDRVSYFPVYETVTLSDRHIAWMDDMVHVTREMVALTVDRMVDAFTGNTHPVETQLPQMSELPPEEDAGSLLLADQARSARALEDVAFFETHKDVAQKSPAFALEYARFLFAQQEYDAALEILAADRRVETGLLRARIFYAKRDYAEAVSAARKVCQAKPKGAAHWLLRLKIAVAQMRLDDIVAIESEWLDADPARQQNILSFVSRAFRQAGSHQQALEKLRQSGIEPADAEGFAALEWGWALLELGRHDEVERIVANFVPRSDWQVIQIKQIRKKLAVEARKAGISK